MSRAYPERPLVGVGVVVMAPEDGHVLLVRRGQPPAQGCWSVPGGAQRLGETLLAAAEREVREETGLAVAPEAVITAVDSIHHDDAGRIVYHYTIVDVAARYIAGEPGPGGDVQACAWAPVGELAAYGLPAEMVAVIAQARAR